MYLQNFVLKQNKLYFITKIKTRETVIFCQKEKKNPYAKTKMPHDLRLIRRKCVQREIHK